MAYSNSKSDCKSISSQKLLQERNRSKTQTETRKVSESDCKSLSPQNCSKKKKPIKKTPENKTKSLQIRLQNRFFREFLRQHKRWKTRTKKHEKLVSSFELCFLAGRNKMFFWGQKQKESREGYAGAFFSGQTQKGSSKGTHVPFHLATPFPITFHVDDFSAFHVAFRSSFFFHQNNLEIYFSRVNSIFLKKILFRGNFAKFFKSKIWKNKK
jgi:hypothetical protein